jgi:cell division protein FtsZ
MPSSRSPTTFCSRKGPSDETVLDSFARADEWIGRGVKSIWAMLHQAPA